MLSFLMRAVVVALLTIAISACAVVGGIFKAGVWVGIIIAVIVIIGLVALFGRG